jgi:hypothetical protein
MTFKLQIDKNSFQFQIIFIGTNPLKGGASSLRYETGPTAVVGQESVGLTPARRFPSI